MSTEIYVNHPTFGLLYRICILGKGEELFTTLYAQRLFFKVITTQQNTIFEPLTRSDSRLLVEGKLRQFRSQGNWDDYKELNQVYQQTFQ